MKVVPAPAVTRLAQHAVVLEVHAVKLLGGYIDFDNPVEELGL